MSAPDKQADLDCRTCRARGLHVSKRICMLEMDHHVIAGLGRMSRRQMVAYARERHVYEDTSRLTHRGRRLCPVALVEPWARDLMEAETNASEYGMTGELVPSVREAFGLIRAEKAEAQAAMIKRQSKTTEEPDTDG